MFIRTQENYIKVLKTILRLKKDLRISSLHYLTRVVGTYLERETVFVSSCALHLNRTRNNSHRFLTHI